MNFSQPEIEPRVILSLHEQIIPKVRKTQSDNCLVDFYTKSNEDKSPLRNINSSNQLNQIAHIQLLSRFAEMGYAPDIVKFLLGKFSGEIEITHQNQAQVSEILIIQMSQTDQQQEINDQAQSEQLIQFSDQDQLQFHEVIEFQQPQEPPKQMSIIQLESDQVSVSISKRSHQDKKVPTENNQGIQIQINNSPECQICMDKMEIEFLIPNCSHCFCYQCVVSYLENMVRAGNVMNVKCPKDGCTQIVAPNTISNLLSDDLNQKYLKFKQRKEIDMDPNKRWCPRIGCENYVSSENCQGYKVNCICGCEICFRCGSFYHDGQSCEGAIDSRFHKAVQEFKIKQCPFCHAPILKNHGCNHMTCYNCKYQFCWLCQKKYGRYHYKFLNLRGCPYFRAQFTNDEPMNPIKIQIFIGILVRISCMVLLIPFILIAIFFTGMFRALKKQSELNKSLKCLRRKCFCCYCIFTTIEQIILLAILPFTFLCYGLPISIKKLCIKVFFPN